MVQTIGQIMSQQRKEQQEQQTSLPDCCPKTNLPSKYGELKDFLVAFNPATQMQICQSSDVCFFGDSPTMFTIRKEYGVNAPTAWLIPQLYDLSEYCGCKGKLTDNQLEQCAVVIATTYPWLKVSELMLFFFRFKSARYGRFYGTVDPLIITSALREFVTERANAYQKREQEEQDRQREESRRNSVTWEEYCIKTYGSVKEHPFMRKQEPKKPEKPQTPPEQILREAKTVIEEIKNSAEDVANVFIRIFKKKYNVTPQEYVKSYKNKEQ